MKIAEFQLPDGRIAQFEVPDGTTQEEATKILTPHLLKMAEAKAPAPIPERSWAEVPKDVAASVVKGVGGLAQFPGQVAGLFTGDFDSLGRKTAEKVEEYGQEMKSAALRAREAATQAKVAAAEKERGQGAAFWESLKGVVTDPVQLPAFLIEQSVQSIPSIAAALIPFVGPTAAAEIKAAQIAAKMATTTVAREAAEAKLKDVASKAAIAAGSRQAVGVGAVQQGADVGFGVFEDAYKKLIKDGVSEQDAAGEAISLARKAGASGAVISLLAQNLPGAKAFERAIAGQRTGAAGRVGTALGIGAKEGLTEMPEEVGGRLARNVAMMQVDPNQTLLEGTGAAAGQALIGGFGMGAVTGAMTGGNQEQVLAEKKNTELLQANAKLEQERIASDARFEEEQKIVQGQEQVAAGQRAQTAQNLGVSDQLLLPPPAEKVVSDVDPLVNPTGNFKPEELSPEVTSYIDNHRKQAGMPKLATYSIEDIQDAMPGKDTAGEQAAIDSLITAKTGYTTDVTYKPEDITNVATQKNIETKTQGFDDFLVRTTGISDVTKMSQPQLHAAFTAMAKLPATEELQILPEGTNATRFTDAQYAKALAVVPAGESMSREALINQVYTDIKPTRKPRKKDTPELLAHYDALQKQNASAIVDRAVRNGDLESTKADDGSVQIRLPEAEDQAGYSIKEEAFKQEGAPAAYQIKSGDRVVSPEPIATIEEANEKLAKYANLRANQVASIDKQISKLQKSVAAGQTKLEQMEISGETQSPAYLQASAAQASMVASVNQKVDGLNKAKQAVSAGLQVVPMASAPRVGFTTYGKGIPQATLPSKQAAEDHILANSSNEALVKIAEAKKPTNLSRRAAAEINRREGKVAPGIKVQRSPVAEKPAEPAVEERDVEADELAAKLTPILHRFGLTGVTLDVVRQLVLGGRKASGSYLGSLMRVAMTGKDPIRTLRHESVHALKELGFFTPSQWKALENQAKKVWIDKYLKQRSGPGTPIKPGQESRYEQYMKFYKGDMDAIIEEAIADAFADFDVNGAPAGAMAALMQRLSNLFTAIKNAMNGLGYQTAEDVFGKIERGELKSQKATEPTPAKPSLEPQKDSMDRVERVSDIGAARKIASSKSWQSNRDFKMALQEAVLAVAGSMDLRVDTPGNRAYITKQLLKEAREALISNANAVGWYDEKVSIALAVTSLIHPELATDAQAQFAFKWALAVTSNGVKVNKNFEIANKAYVYWKNSNSDPALRRFPTSDIGVGTAAGKIHDALKTYNILLSKWGFDKFQKFATTLQTNRQVEAEFGRKVSGEGADTMVYGAGVVGPKIGNGFFMNLYGEFGQLTMDRWWVRMWGRVTGDLVKVDRANVKKTRDAFVGMIDMIKSDKEAARVVEQTIGTNLSKGDPVKMAKAIIRATTKEEVRAVLDGALPATPQLEVAATALRGKLTDFISIGDELRKSANAFIKTLDGQIEVPGGSRRRDMMRDVSASVLKSLQKDHPHLTTADFQALMWYPEKTLYDSAGAQEQDEEGYNDDEAPDYANAAIELAKKQGVTNEQITKAVNSAKSDIQARRRSGGVGRGSFGVSQKAGEGAGSTAGVQKPSFDESAGDGRGRTSAGRFAPLKDAPSVTGISGPIPEIVRVAEKYAKENGINLKRQSEYVKVDPKFGKRVADAYAAMEHKPNDPVVKEAYENLIRQTTAQYEALVDAGYKFWFTDLNIPENVDYLSTPWNALRELKTNKSIGTFPTDDGFGTGDFDPASNPMLADTGIRWPVGSLKSKVTKPVMANDLFRAVHDAFGHGMEGAGFRSDGEENAWQAHARLFTGSALGAITSETRGQNSELNFGKHGKHNQTASVEDTIFADQKTGLMPEWTWTDNRAGDMDGAKPSLSAEEKENVDGYVRSAKSAVRPGDSVDEGSGISLGKRQEGAGTFNGVHYGKLRVEELDSSKYGTGLQGSEARRLGNHWDDRVKKRVYFYIPKFDGTMPQVESGVGGHVYTQKFNNIAFGTALGKIHAEARGDANTMESLIVDAGYDGYAVPSMGMMVVLNHDVPVNYQGNKAEYDAKKAKPESGVKLSLSEEIDNLPGGQDINRRIGETTTAREEKGHVRRMVEAFSPKNYSKFRAAAIHRYNQIGVYSREVAKQKGDPNWLLADVSAEAAANMSDLAMGVSASALGVGDRKGGVPVYRNGITTVFNDDGKIKGAVEIFSTLAKHNDPYVYQAYQFWAGVKRGSRFMNDGKEHLFTPADKAFAAELLKKYPEFEQVQKDWIVYNNGLVDYGVATGVLTEAAGNEFKKHGDYIPFYRQLDGESTVGPNVFQSISGVRAPKKLTGSTEQLGDFLETVVRNTQSMIESGMKNIAAERVIRDAVYLNTAVKLKHKQTRIDVVTVMEKGVPAYYEVSDILLIEAMKGLNLPEIPFLGLVAGPANLLRAMVTKDPGFMLANMMRDSVAAWVTSGVKMKPIADTAINFGKAIARRSGTYEALVNAGVVGGYDFSGNVESTGRDLADDLRTKTGTKTKMAKALTPVTSLWKALEKGSTASDAATRMAIYDSVMKETGNEAEAIYRALEVMNFNRKGNSAAVRILTAAVPFLNARVQGLDVLYRSSFGKMATKDAKSIQKNFFIRGATLMALTAMYYALTSDDDEYKAQEQEVRDNNWLIPSLGIRIPIPFEIGVLFKVIPERIMAYGFGDDTKEDFLKSMGRQLANTLAFNPIPQAVLPIVENITNYSFFTGKDIVSQGLEGVAPEFQIQASTSEAAKTIGAALGMSPIKIDHLIGGYTGTMGVYMVDLMNSIYEHNADSPRVDKRFEQMPVIKRFILDKDAKGSVSAYYDLKNSTDEMVRTINLLERTQNFSELGEFYQNNLKLLATKEYVKDLGKTMKELQDYSKRVQSSPMDGAAKRDLLDTINQAQNALTANIKYIRKSLDD